MELNVFKAVISGEIVLSNVSKPDCRPLIAEGEFWTILEKPSMLATFSLASLILCPGSSGSTWWWMLIHNHKNVQSTLFRRAFACVTSLDLVSWTWFAGSEAKSACGNGSCNRDDRTQGIPISLNYNYLCWVIGQVIPCIGTGRHRWKVRGLCCTARVTGFEDVAEYVATRHMASPAVCSLQK